MPKKITGQRLERQFHKGNSEMHTLSESIFKFLWKNCLTATRKKNKREFTSLAMYNKMSDKGGRYCGFNIETAQKHGCFKEGFPIKLKTNLGRHGKDIYNMVLEINKFWFKSHQNPIPRRQFCERLAARWAKGCAEGKMGEAPSRSTHHMHISYHEFILHGELHMNTRYIAFKKLLRLNHSLQIDTNS